MDVPTTPERGSEPWRGDALNRRRWRLFMLAAPIFRQHGFRGATIKQVAHACHLSPAALYHYFPSKVALATFLIDQPLPTWAEAAPPADGDPLEQLREMLDSAIVEMPDYILSIDLARQVGRPMGAPELAAKFGGGDALFGTRIAAAMPRLDRAGAQELARRLVAILVSPYMTGLDVDAGTTRARAVDVLRLHMLPGGVDRDHFERVMATR
jgi:AcrR family transcriptional regulator